MRLVTKTDIIEAADRIKGAALRTPLVPAVLYPDATADSRGPGRELWLKPENLQLIGAFKIRGAANVLAQLPDSARERGVVAYSSGNHAQAVAHAARQAGVPALIVIDDTAPKLKLTATRALGAEVVTVPLGDRQRVAEQIAVERGATLVPPFDHPAVIAGQGTIGLEIMADLPDADVVLVPVSGGGLASGVGVAVKALRPATAVFGVEPELAGDAAASLAAGHLVHWPVEERVKTIADGLRAEPSELTFAHLGSVLDGILTVSEAEIRAAVGLLARQARLVAEPAGAVATAAALFRADQLPAGKVVTVVSGGNIEPTLLAEILTG
ncbi:MAG TPA: threonine/serine dehydratase [Pseudonocardiaceae bacterium]|nr:threonine/serine dehydratase [Pseudonocardiaceae bacterium]